MDFFLLKGHIKCWLLLNHKSLNVFFLFISVQRSNFLISQILFISSIFSVFSIAMEDCKQNITAHRLFLVVRLFLKDLIADDVLRHIFSNRKKKKKLGKSRAKLWEFLKRKPSVCRVCFVFC